MLNLKREHLNLEYNVVSLFGWESCPVSDDSLSSEKIWPGACFRSMKVPKTSPWYARSQVTAESLELFVNMVAAQHGGLAVGCRAKLATSVLEEKAELCAAAVAMGNEVLQSVPNCKDAVQRFLDIEL